MKKYKWEDSCTAQADFVLYMDKTNMEKQLIKKLVQAMEIEKGEKKIGGFGGKFIKGLPEGGDIGMNHIFG